VTVPTDPDALALIVPASMLFITAAARHLWVLRRISRDTERDVETAIKRLRAFRGF
jgi:hypothetical protein